MSFEHLPSKIYYDVRLSHGEPPPPWHEKDMTSPEECLSLSEISMTGGIVVRELQRSAQIRYYVSKFIVRTKPVHDDDENIVVTIEYHDGSSHDMVVDEFQLACLTRACPGKVINE